MDYYSKYIKYKTKYLNISSNKYLLKGSGKPSFLNLKDINLFSKGNFESDIEKHLNPVFGFIWSEFDAITNYYHFKNNIMWRFVTNTFNEIDGLVEPSDKIKQNFKPHDLGILLGCRYICKQINKKVKQTTYYIECIEKMTSNYTDIGELIKNIKINYIINNNPVPTNNKSLLVYLKKYIRILDDYKKSLIAKSNNCANPIVKEFIRKKIINSLNDTNEDVEYFHVVLAIVWHISHTKSGIKDYYLGINYILPLELQVIIPDDFTTDIFSMNDFTKDITKDITGTNYFNYILAKNYKIKMGSIKIHTQESATIDPTISYPDCGESALRTFINILAYNESTGLFDLKRLKPYGPNEQIKEYYKIFNNDQIQSSLKQQKIFNKELNARDAWSIVVSNISGVKYNETITKDDLPYKYNIKGKLSKITDKDGNRIQNILQVLKNLFSKINDFTDFNNDINNITIDMDLNENGFGTIKINTALNNDYELICNHRHYEVDILLKDNDLDTKFNYDDTKLTPIELYYMKLLTLPIEQLCITEEIIKQKKWHYFYKYTVKDLIYLVNEYNLTQNDYMIIFNYIHETYNKDNKMNIIPNLNKIDNISSYNFTDYIKIYIEYDDTLYKNHGNIIYYIGCNYAELDKLINLKLLIFDKNFNKPLGNSLYKLTNLKTLTFGNNFNTELGTSLNNLTKLETLTFGDGFNIPLESSLDKLTNLKTLTFGHDFNAELGTSLNNLTNLEKITFGDDFNTELGKSLYTLRKLEKITFGDKFNTELGDSLYKLRNLKYLIFGHDFNAELGNSLSGLRNLERLIFGDNFNTELENSLNELRKLEKLRFGDKFNTELGNSLYKLRNLKVLIFGNDFNVELGNSLYGLRNLKDLTFGNDFNVELGDSLYELTNLKWLAFGNDFNVELGDSLYELTNLEWLTFGNDFNTELGTSLEKLTNLKTLIFGNEFTAELGTSLEKLTNLKTLTIPRKKSFKRWDL
jgi:hypothetical protein